MTRRLIARLEGRPAKLAATLLTALAAMLALSAVAGAEEVFLFKIGGGGVTGGKFNEPAGLSTNNATGNIYVADRLNNRIQELGPNGEFILAWGYDVVASGEDDKPKVDEVQRIRYDAIGGSYTLTYEGQSTAPLAYSASASEIEAALNGLASINSGGGKVSVSGSGPYVVTFDGGPLKETDRAPITADPDQLVHGAGSTLNCENTARYVEKEGTISFQWLANGEPIAGATSGTYTTQAGDAGKAVQCQIELTYENARPYPKSWDVNPNYHLVGPMATAPPEPPANIAEPSGPPIVSAGSGGEVETCEAGSWGNSPTSYTYQWYMHNAPLGPSTTTAATSNQITLTEDDVAERALLQCKVTATNAGGSIPMWSDIRETEPGPPFGGLFEFGEAAPRVTIPGTGRVVATSRNGGVQFEVCKAAPSTDVCKAGVEGDGLGQMSAPRGVAVDNSPGGSGDVWVGDDLNLRVQKFTEGGTPILEVGGDVNQTDGSNVCTVASGDDCGPGSMSIDQRPGRFGGWPPGRSDVTGAEELGNTVGVDPNNGRLFVTDPYNTAFVPLPPPRVQMFDKGGDFLGFLVPPQFAGPPEMTSVNVDSESRVLVTRHREAGGAVDLFDESEFTPEGTQRGWAERTQIDDTSNPRDVSADPGSDKIWVVDRNTSDFEFTGQYEVCAEGITEGHFRALVAFDHEGHMLDCTTPTGLGRIRTATGLVVTDAGRAYVSIREENIIKVYRLPQETEPSVGRPDVGDITTGSVKVSGTVSAGFEPTEYSFEYGTSPCSTGSCQKVQGPNKAYGLKFAPVEQVVTGLEPGTRYYYRIVATNPIGTVAGTERTFATYPFIDLKNDPCENVLVRKQTRTAGLLDCRAYELASAGFTGGYDVISDLAPGQTPFEGFPEASGKVLYAVRDGGIPGTGFPTNLGPDPYVAVRGADGWSTRYVGIPSNGTLSTAPFSSRPSDVSSLLETFAFGGGDICSPCFNDGSSGIPVHMPDGSLVQGMTGSEPKPGAASAGYVADPMSADGRHLVFGTTSKLEPAATEGGDVKIYDRDLAAATTQVVSTSPGGELLTGPDIGELAISRDGDRIVVGQKVGTPDAKGNSSWHLYMHIGNSANSVDLTPGTTTGVLFLGMSGDGSRVFYSTEDALAGSGDGDTGVDVFEVEVSGIGPVIPELISAGAGGPVNSDSCSPVGYPDSWNSIAGDGRCNAVGFAGGAGVARDGSVYFLSPELLAGGGEGEAGQANLYVTRPGDGAPAFVATIDSSVGNPPAPAPKHDVADGDLIAGLSEPVSLAVDQNSGDIFVADSGAGKVKRFTSAGAVDNFSDGPGTGKNEIPANFGGEGAGEIAVDSSGGPMNGNLYVTNFAGTIDAYSATGKALGSLSGLETPCGVAVDQSNGDVYVAELSQRIWRFVPTSAPSPTLSNADYMATSLSAEAPAPRCQLAAGGGAVYASGYPNGPLVKFTSSQFTADGEEQEGTTLTAAGSTPPSHEAYVDPATGELHVDTGAEVAVFDSGGKVVKRYGAGAISGYGAIAVNGGQKPGQSAKAGHSYATDGSKVVEFAPATDTYEPIDDPAIVHAVDDNEVHRWSDFQTSGNGAYALFTSQQKLDPGYENAGFRGVYRYDAANDALSCASCLSTEAPPSSDAALPTQGLGITNDGRAFFNSSEALVMRDSNEKLDAYEWSPQLAIPGGCKAASGCQSLISTGISSSPSSLLTTTEDGVDAFFFTRETLVSGDSNGQAMKIYDARAGGGFFELPASPPCAASDECHGAGSKAPPPPPNGTHEGTGGNAKPTCRKGFRLKQGKCLRKPRHKHRKHHRRAHHGGRGSR